MIVVYLVVLVVVMIIGIHLLHRWLYPLWTETVEDVRKWVPRDGDRFQVEKILPNVSITVRHEVSGMRFRLSWVSIYLAEEGTKKKRTNPVELEKFVVGGSFRLGDTTRDDGQHRSIITDYQGPSTRT